MFTKEELELIEASLTEYWLRNEEEYERQKAKGRRDCVWHLSVMEKIDKLQSKIYYIKNSMQ